MVARVLGALCGALLLYAAWRPRMLRWGATEEEAAAALPGDERAPSPRVQSTRAITIDAPPERIWPWLVQMGIGRAGFYSHDRIERLLFRARYVEGTRSATRIHPELQHLEVGDLVPYGAGVLVPVHALEPGRYLVHGEAWVLRPLDDRRTRLLVRTRGDGYLEPALVAAGPDAPWLVRRLAALMARVPALRLAARAVDVLVADPLHHVMDVGMLRGIKRRTEAEQPGRVELTPG